APVEAGRFSLVRVAAVDGLTATVDPAPDPAIRVSSTARAQLCELREYANLTIAPTGLLAAAAWTGTSGGFAGFAVSGTLTIDGELGASGAGFRGAPIDLASALGGTGESFLEPPTPADSASGAANGGAGGHCGANNGGGGGAGGGAGGRGGAWTGEDPVLCGGGAGIPSTLGGAGVLLLG